MNSARSVSHLHSRALPALLENQLIPGYFRLYTRKRSEHEIYSVNSNTLVAYNPKVKAITAQYELHPDCDIHCFDKAVFLKSTLFGKTARRKQLSYDFAVTAASHAEANDFFAYLQCCLEREKLFRKRNIIALEKGFAASMTVFEENGEEEFHNTATVWFTQYMRELVFGLSKQSKGLRRIPIHWIEHSEFLISTSKGRLQFTLRMRVHHRRYSNHSRLKKTYELSS